jgi:putative transposase
LGPQNEEDKMRKSRFTEEQITYALRRSDSGISSDEICREMGVSQAAFYKWKKKYAGMGISELRQLKSLEDENRRLKKLVADLSLDKHMLQEVLAKKF